MTSFSDTNIRAAYIGGVFLLVSVVIAGVFGLWQGVFANDSNDNTLVPTPRTAVAQNVTDTPVVEPTINDFQQLQTQTIKAELTQAAFDRIATEVQLRNINVTGTIAQIAATEAAANANNVALAATLTPRPTNTLEPPTKTLQPTPTSTDTPTKTYMPTPMPTSTLTPSLTFTMTRTTTKTSTPRHTATIFVPSITPAVTITPQITISLVSGTYPCSGTVISSDLNSLLIIYARPISRFSPIVSILPETDVLVLDDTLESGRKWYKIQYGDDQKTGWVWDNYLSFSSKCP